MDEFTKRNTGESRAQYVLRLAAQKNDEVSPKVNEPKTSTNAMIENNNSFAIQNIISSMNVDCVNHNQPNTIIIEEVNQMDSGPDGYEYVKSLLDYKDLQELPYNGELSIINTNYSEDPNSSLEQNIIIQEPLNRLTFDGQKMVEVTEPNSDTVTEENTLQNLDEITIKDFFVQGNNKNFSIIQEQEMTPDIDDSYQGSNYFSKNETPVSSEELYSSENGEEERGENEEETQETYSDSDNDNSVKKRKALRNPETWKRSVAKKRRNEGLEYVNVKKKLVKSRRVGSPCSNKCRLKCRYQVTQEQCEEIHKRFWKIGDIHRQRDYFLQCMDPINPKYRMHTPNSNRSKNYAYHFEIEGERTRVCKLFYLKTLDISNKLIFTATKKKDESGILQPDMRGKHKKGGRKVTDEIKEDIRNHIKSFPTMPSHYCRAQTNKNYIDGSLNIATMYRLYKANCQELNKPFAKQSMYETIFNTEFNIAFYTPKKDQCMTCESLKNCTETNKELIQANYDKHIKEKTLCRQEKENDINEAKLDNTKHVACFDLQAVLSVPCGDISAFFYKRRLATYNFTIYDVVGKQGFCFTWHEGLGKRGANEIGSCLYIFLKNHAKSANITLYSDNCAGQNKNKFVVSLLLHCVNSIENIEEITYKFLVVGHTQNEGDAMHALIEREKKCCLRSGAIYTPDQLIPIIRLAKKTGTAYKCIEMNYTDFLDVKHLQSEIGKNFNQNVTGEKVHWQEICAIKVMKTSTFTIFYKESYAENDYKEIDVRYKTRGKSYSSNKNINLKKLYANPIKISQAKKNDLIRLCDANAIPSQYWSFYKNLPSTLKPCNNKPADSDSD